MNGCAIKDDMQFATRVLFNHTVTRQVPHMTWCLFSRTIRACLRP